MTLQLLSVDDQIHTYLAIVTFIEFGERNEDIF